MNKKYEITDIRHATIPELFRIKALIDFADIKAGDLGGFVEKESNLSHGGTCWIYGNASVRGNTRVYGNAVVYDNTGVLLFPRKR